MSTVRRTISMPPAVAARLDAQAAERDVTFSALVVELIDRPARLPYAGTADDPDPDLSLRLDEIMSRLAE